MRYDSSSRMTTGRWPLLAQLQRGYCFNEANDDHTLACLLLCVGRQAGTSSREGKPIVEWVFQEEWLMLLYTLGVCPGLSKGEEDLSHLGFRQRRVLWDRFCPKTSFPQ